MLNSFFILGCLQILLIAERGFAEDLPKLQGNTTLEQLTDVQRKNTSSQMTYSIAAVKLAQEGAYKFAHGGDCQLSCPYGCCDSSAGLVLEGGVFMLLNNTATMQARTNQLAAAEACRTYNKLSSSAKNCTAETKGFDMTKPEANWFDEKGKCKPGAPQDCQLLSRIPGSAIFGTKRVNCKTGTAGCDQDFFSTYKSNPDGSITIMSGRASKKPINLSIDSFKSVASLIAAGVPKELADSLMGEFAIQSKRIGNAKAELLSMNQEQKKDLVKSPNPAEYLEKSSETTGAGLNLQNEKRLANDGLTRMYKGESIHNSSSNIFEVMALRYKKTSDSLLP